MENIVDSGIEDSDALVSKISTDLAVLTLDCSFCWDQKVQKTNTFDKNKANGKIHLKDRNDNKSGLLKGNVILHNINFSVKHKELVSIYGPVGSGKSSLLSGLLGEMQGLKGEMFLQRNVAYVPQRPWILNDTIQRNIVFTSPFDPERYQQVVAACALEHDISEFPGGHHTELGDKGMNLSGGQKARVSLARACYSSAPVVFLDDPFSAVDAPTAKHLIDQVLKGIMKERTIILITHNEAALSVCDRIYYMDNGHLTCRLEGIKKGDSQGSSALAIPNDTESEDYSAALLTGQSKRLQGHGFELANDDGKGKSTIKEDKVEGIVHFSTWTTYARASGGFLFFSFVILVFIFAQAVRLMVDYWVRIWTEENYHLRKEVYLTAYASFAAGAITLFLCKVLLFSYATSLAATSMHGQMAEKVLRSPQIFFDQNIAGRILNRFSKDQALVDELLPTIAQQMFDHGISSLGNLILIGIIIPWFLLTFPPLVLIFFYTQRRYVVISRELKRLEAISRSPLYGHFTQTFQGIDSVRAYGIQSEMRKVFMSLVDANHRPYIHLVHMKRWFAARLDFATCVCVTFASILVILLRNSITPGLAGLILVLSFQVTACVQFAIRQAADTENLLTSVERIKAYASLPSEASPITPPGIIVRNWPSRGEIQFESYTMSYRVDLPPVLNDISFQVHAREKVGILGRTGVGKSSLVGALFRMVENEKCNGNILIDGVNIKLIGLDDLRWRLSIIPQDPILFEGSLRFNLDPFEANSDEEMYGALARVNLTKKVQNLERGLDSLLVQNGENFSVGERQLICLARSLLKSSRIVVMDEATAAVDRETDNLIQAAIQTTFCECTVLTIAHRIETVINCDRVLVLAAGGRIAEFDSPSNLLQHHQEGGGIFAEMVRQTGPTMSKKLYRAAQDAERRRKEDPSKTSESEQVTG